MRLLLFTSNITGELLLEKLDSYSFYPDTVTYTPGARRTALSRDFSPFAMKFPLIQISRNRYSEEEGRIKADADTVAVCIDWTKDFFHDFPGYIIYSHPSLLPMYRGYSAITEQFARGVVRSGASFYKAGEKIDGGDILRRENISIDFKDYPIDFLEKYAECAASFILDLADNGLEQFTPEPQDETKAFYLARKRKKEAVIDFNRDAFSLYNHIRAFSRPFFGAYFRSGCKEYTVWKASTEKWQGEYGEPGTVLSRDSAGIEIACGSGAIMLEEVECDGLSIRPDELEFS
ncbi:methionyl-tRNA formyltransferase [Limisalsivibrio acetivorans]|uniref:methionyl-tRNA formyltransferase n=1 Tax=Limisalsivibrio acetivorans TaxID=1304888 RepID=UPI0003B5D9E8|nr:formyltransferase family protein [Limisalsivibrio acetivorans]